MKSILEQFWNKLYFSELFDGFRNTENLKMLWKCDAGNERPTLMPAVSDVRKLSWEFGHDCEGHGGLQKTDQICGRMETTDKSQNN
jgi:hypothetical protein